MNTTDIVFKKNILLNAKKLLTFKQYFFKLDKNIISHHASFIESALMFEVTI